MRDGTQGMNPLAAIEYAKDRLPERVYNRIVDRYRYVKEGVDRVERASGIKYPLHYVEPSITIVEGNGYGLDFGLIFARTIPVVENDDLRIVVQLSAPLVAYALKGTIHAVLAHEFLHYLELITRFINVNVVSDEVSSTLFEDIYADMGRLFDAKHVLGKDRSLLTLIAKRFKDGFNDSRLESKCIKEWIEKGLPSRRIGIEDNIARIPMEAIAKMRIDDSLRSKIYELINTNHVKDGKSGRGRRKGRERGGRSI